MLLNFRYCISFWLCLTIVWSAQAQTPILRLTNEKARPTDGDIDYESPIGNTKGRLWIAYSDRANNPTYTEPDENASSQKTLSYLDWFYVIDEQGAYIRIAKGELDESEGNLNQIQDYGWLPKRKAIMHPYCLQSRAKISKKAILLNNIDTVSKVDFARTTNSVALYNHPEASKGKQTGESRLFEVFYVYKVNTNAVLIGKTSYNDDPLNASNNLIGWVDRRKVIFWDNRVAIEPNWQEAALKERSATGFSPIIVNKKRTAEVFRSGQNIASELVYLDLKDKSSKRMDGYEWRYPVLTEFRGSQDAGILSVGAMGKISQKAGTVSEDIRREALKKYEKGREKQKNINIVFVLDATEGTQPYHAAAVKALRSVQDKIVANSSNSIKFAALAYRNSGAGDKQTEIKPLSNNVEKTIEFIEGLNTDYPSSGNGTQLYTAIKNAIQQSGISDKHTNILIVVGREGDSGTNQVAESELATLLFAQNCHLMALQAESQEADTYQDFSYQMEALIKKSAQKRYEKFKTKTGKGTPPELEELRATDYQKFVLRNTAAMGQLVLPNFGESINSQNLQTEIAQIVANANSRVNSLLNVLDRLFKGAGTTQEGDLAEFNASVLYFIIDQAELSEEESSSFSFENFQGSKEGFAVRNVKGLQYPIFKSSLFLDGSELSEMYDQLKDLDLPDAPESEQREAMVRAWLKLLRSYEGGTDPDQLKELTMEEVNEKVFGLPGSSPLLRGLKLAQIHDLPADKFQKYLSNIRSKRQKLLDIMEEKDYKFSFLSYGRRYYWIDEDLLP